MMWLLLVIPAGAWLVGAGYLSLLAVMFALGGGGFRSRRFLAGLGMALIWPAWCWRRS